ncbi:Aste57867_10804 [Aphanomyces stellatus]|uniref:Aste57867_10804 protein n=1 Tax=Aphanomyces stellatus TaxID=120398 RepID=A0A485KS17_9STRA|nr:hypothetical protein As57867_010764 [Aphanomyces stellatus]VFT87673.1 Aste57867_10804 [Aphanomyces stellatus]
MGTHGSKHARTENFSNVAEDPRESGHAICVFHRKYTLPHTVSLHMMEKLWSWTGDNFTIKDRTTGAPFFKLSGDALSVRRHKSLRDVDGTVVARMEEPDSVARCQQVMTPSKTHLFDIVLRVAQCKYVLECTFGDCESGATHSLGMVGDWLSRKLIVTCNGIPIAKIWRPAGLPMDQYYVDISPQVDVALIVLVCVALEEAAEPKLTSEHSFNT